MAPRRFLFRLSSRVCSLQTRQDFEGLAAAIKSGRYEEWVAQNRPLRHGRIQQRLGNVSGYARYLRALAKGNNLAANAIADASRRHIDGSELSELS